MSLSKEKQLILKIKEIVNDTDFNASDIPFRFAKIKELVNTYKDADYITGPIVGIPYGPEDEYRESGSGTNKPETE